ncbi:MAG: glycosyltransferase family 2 protein [Oricola sp.]|jgi:polyprenyl-phospho-N-acetylgalactosaminyl synthase|nr:glycosyltransferase family 2 protein [Oricola sp.]
MITETPNSGADIWFVVPAFNEAAVIGDVVKSLAPYGKVIVIDDGSRDQTGSTAEDAGAILLRHLINRGQGAALQTGLAFAHMNAAKTVITFDADGQHRIEDALRMAARLDAEGLDIVLGSRFLGDTENMPFMRRMVLSLAVLFTRATTGLRVTDAHNGLRAMTGAAAGLIRLRQDRMAHASELLSEVAKKNLRYAEEPVTIRYTQYSLAKGQRLSNAFSILEELFLGLFSR